MVQSGLSTELGATDEMLPVPVPVVKRKMENPVKKLREALQLSQEALAPRLGVSYQSIRNYERNIPKAIIQKLITLAVEGGLPEIAMELSDGKWPVKRPGEARVSQAPKKFHLQERDFGAELHSLLDGILQGPVPNIEATESALRLFANPARQQPVPVNRPRRRRG